MNQQRSARGEQLVHTYTQLEGMAMDQDAPQDLIADLCHYWQSQGNNPEQIRTVLRLGFDHFETELEEEA